MWICERILSPPWNCWVSWELGVLNSKFSLHVHVHCIPRLIIITIVHRQERKKYYSHREKARANPDKYITLIIDGMDQSKTNLPKLTKTPKAVQGLQQLRTHITGVLAHTRAPHGKYAFAYIDMLQYPHDCNLTIHVLLNALLEFKDKLPPVLNLQLDNTARENKNKYFLGFCALLVAKKVFRKVSNTYWHI